MKSKYIQDPEYITHMGFVDGVKPAYDPVATPKTAIWEARNVDVDNIGILRLRPGYEEATQSLGISPFVTAISIGGEVWAVYKQSIHRILGGD